MEAARSSSSSRRFCKYFRREMTFDHSTPPSCCSARYSRNPFCVASASSPQNLIRYGLGRPLAREPWPNQR
eukprot:2159225-Prymnesium_polylepis.1